MIHRGIYISLIIFLMLPQTAMAKPTKAEQAAFTQEYDSMRAKGGEEFNNWKASVSSGNSDDRNDMLRNLEAGKTADGRGERKPEEKKPQGFMGDPKDPGPTDWSDWNIKTDANGNVIGFEEKDFEEKDADGDGEISDEEREEWNKKKKKEHEEAGGAPGEVPPVADWDKDGDGIPDKGWTRWCWQCCPGEELLNECHYGRPGNCDNNGSCDISEICHQADELHDGKAYECHTCEYLTDQPDWCREKGYSSDPACGGQCPPKACVPVDIDIKTGKLVPANKTRERGSTRQCYTCLTDSAESESYTSVGQDGVPSEQTAVKAGMDYQDGPGFSQIGTGGYGEGVVDGKKWQIGADIKYDAVGSGGAVTEVPSDTQSTYFTPRFSGFQIGTAYEPRLREGPEQDFSSETQYVKPGDYYGQGFYYIPGTEQRLSVSGHVRADSDWIKDAFCDEEMDGWASPDCDGDCYPDEECVPTRPAAAYGVGRVQCYYCAKKKKDSLIDGISGATPMISVPSGVFISSPQTPAYCSPNISKAECGKCSFFGGQCRPLAHTSLSRNMEPCYECVFPQTCDQYGLICDCSSCPSGTLCTPAKQIDGGVCYACLKNWTVEVQTYVFIRETPFGRVVLDNPSAMLQGFSPSSILALANVDQSQIAAIQKAASLMQGGFSVGTVKEVAGMMSEKLGKQRKFSNDCFNDFAPLDRGEAAPGGAGGGKGKSKGAKSVKGGKGVPELPEQGPIIACGQKDGKDVLAVFDAQGALIATVLKDELQKNPDSILAALAKAQESGQRLLAMSRMSPEDLIKQGISKLASRITRPRDPQGVEAGGTKLVPNDPLYWKDAGKKKSKVKERMKKVVSGGISGGVTIGTGGSDKKGPNIEDQWGIREVGYLPLDDPDSAWNQVKIDGPNIVVAVIDSGLDMSHPDGPRYIWRNKGEIPGNHIDDDNNGYIDDVYGWNFIDNNNDLRDYKGHGTFVAGIIAAKWNNGIGIAGINPGAVIMPLKAADAGGEALNLNIYRAVYYAVNNGAQVINISLGGRGVSELEQKAIDYAREKNVFVVVASGNVGENIGGHGPAAAQSAFPVGSLDADGKKSTISNWGPNNGLIAPGEKIYSLRSFESFDPRKVSKDTEFYYTMSGTSFSAPMVAATASLLLTKNPGLTAADIEDILQASADDLYDEGWDGESGAGLLNASRALKMTPKDLTTVKITRLQINRDSRGRPESVDVYATVRGKVKEFTLGAGKGERAGRLSPIAGPFNKEYNNEFVQRVNIKDSLRGSDKWIIGITAKDKSGKEHQARTLLSLE